MMTENEFKLHMSVYLDRQMQPVLRHVKELENRLHRVEALLEGNVSPAFPYVTADTKSTGDVSSNTDTSNASELDNKIAAMRAITARLKGDSSDTLPEDEDSMEIMDLLKSIHTNVRVIKRYVVERDPSLANYL